MRQRGKRCPAPKLGRTRHWSRRPTACARASLRLLGAAHRGRSAPRGEGRRQARTGGAGVPLPLVAGAGPVIGAACLGRVAPPYALARREGVGGTVAPHARLSGLVRAARWSAVPAHVPCATDLWWCAAVGGVGLCRWRTVWCPVRPACAGPEPRGIAEPVCPPTVPAASVSGVTSPQDVAGGSAQGSARTAGVPPTSAGGAVAWAPVRQSPAGVTHVRRGRGHCADRLTPEHARLPRVQRLGAIGASSHAWHVVSPPVPGVGAAAPASTTLQGVSPPCAGGRARMCSGGLAGRRRHHRAGGDRVGRASGAQRGRTRACRRPPTASAPASLRPLAAPDA